MNNLVYDVLWNSGLFSFGQYIRILHALSFNIYFYQTGPNFIIKDLLSVLILITDDQIVNASLCYVLTNTTDINVDS